MKLRTFFPICLLSMLIHTSASAQNGSSQFYISHADGAVRYAGYITPEGIAELKPLLKDGASLIIESAGGNENSAIDLGNLIFDKKIFVTLDTYCLSACADVMLVSANGRLTSNGAVIGLHYSSYSVSEYSKEAGLSLPADFTGVVDRIVALYDKTHGNLNLLRTASEKIGMHAVPDATNDAATAKWFGKYKLWVPSDAELKMFNIDIPATGLAAQKERQAYILGTKLSMTDKDIVY